MTTRCALNGALWCGAIALALFGAASAVGRSMFISDFALRAEPHREQIFRSLAVDDPFHAQRDSEVHRLDGKYGRHPVLTLLHVAPGGVFLLLGLFQFSSRLRRRYVAIHRWSGRMLIVVAFVSVSSGLVIGVRWPYAGTAEMIPVVLFGCLFLAAVGRAFFAIRTRQVALHREWMIRAFAIAIAISTVRVVMAVFDVTLTPAGVAPRDAFVLSIWTGWTMTVAAGEAWIRYTRASVGSPVMAPAASGL